jgi:hypothetical protein
VYTKAKFLLSNRVRLAGLEEEGDQRDLEPLVLVRLRPDFPPRRHPHQQPLQQGHPDLQEGQDLLLQRGAALLKAQRIKKCLRLNVIGKNLFLACDCLCLVMIIFSQLVDFRKIEFG